MKDLAVRKMGNVFKIYKLKSRSLIEGLIPIFHIVERCLPFLRPTFVQAEPHRTQRKLVDLSFSNLEFANVYLELAPNFYNPPEKPILTASKAQLNSIFKAFDINPSDFVWADLWCGRRNWAIALSQITGRQTLAIDADEFGYGPPFNSPLVNFQSANTSETPLPENVTACFLRSIVGAESLRAILKLNPNIKLFVVVPEGLGSNEGFPFDDLVKPLKDHFETVVRIDLQSEIGIKGSHSQIISFNQYFPLIVARR